MENNKVDNIIELRGIGKSFEENEAVVNDINLAVKRGEFVTLLGPSGCGKTTTLRMIAGFEIPSEGQILLEGKDISSLQPYVRSINTVLQRYDLYRQMNVYEKMAFGLKIKKRNK